MDDEIRFHLHMVEEKLVSHGMDEREARAEALRRFGDREAIRRRLLGQARRREGRMRWSERWDRWRMDLVFALRQLGKHPGTSALAVGVLALGIGAGTAVFSIVDSVLLEPLPFPEPHELMVVREVDPDRGTRSRVSAPTYLDWREGATTIDGLTVFMASDADVTDPGRPARVGFASVSREFFDVLGVSPARGRGFTELEDRSGTPPVVVISDRLRRRQFGPDGDPLGRTVTVRGQPLTVVGVAPPGFDFPEDTDVWAPLFALAGFDATVRGARILQAVARLSDGVPQVTARKELEAINRREAGYGAAVTPLKEHMVGDLDHALFLLLGAVGLVLLVACANVGNVLLTRALGRKRELAVRTALGASRARVTATLLTESLLVAVLAGVAGTVLAWFGSDLLLGLAPTDLPRAGSVGLDAGVLAVALALTLVTGLVVGALPAQQARDADLATRLRAGDTRQSGDRAGGRVRSALVVGQITLTMVLLAGAGLLGRSFVAILSEDPGFDPSGLATVGFDLPRHRYAEPDRLRSFYRELIPAVEALPQVTGAALTRNLPLSGRRMTSPALTDGQEGHDPSLPQAHISWVTPGYFEVMDVTVLDGRTFETADVDAARTPVVVNETFARTFFPDRGAVGREARTYFTPDFHPVVGVVEDVRHGSLSGEMRPLIYHLIRETPSAGFHMVVRAGPDASAAEAFSGLRGLLERIDPELPPPEMATMDDLVSRDVAEPRFYAVMLGAFAVLTLVLATLGLYGLMATAVLQQQREIGIRLALGAGTSRVTALFLGRAMVLAVLGVLLGLGAALLAGRSLESLLYGVEPADPVTLAGVSLLLLGACLVATVVPVRRAGRVDPAETLQAE